jgi:hypothetical protein
VKLLAPFRGTLEWAVQAGADVALHAVLAWVSVADHCAVRPLVAPRGGLLTWRRHPELCAVEAGEPVALIGGDDEALAHCLAEERTAARALLERLEHEAAQLPPSSPLAAVLLEPERRALAARIARLRALIGT